MRKDKAVIDCRKFDYLAQCAISEKHAKQIVGGTIGTNLSTTFGNIGASI